MPTQDPQTTINTKYGKILPVGIVAEMEKSYLDYAMSVIVARALPDVRDGLKPVHRRIIFAMHQMNLTPGGKYSKSAKVVGEVLGKYHPHGDQSVYNAMVRMAQEFSLRYPLVKGQGNFGSIDNDPPAAMRYTEAKMSKISTELITDIDKDTVDTTQNFDGTIQEPTVLPAQIPALLLNGADGIAVGMATKIPPHNIGEICQAIDIVLNQTSLEKIKDNNLEIKPLLEKQSTRDRVLAPVTALDNQKYNLETKTTVENLLRVVTGPDFPTYGEIYGQEGIHQMYQTGQGKFMIRSKTKIEESKNGKAKIIVTQIPYQINKADLVQKIANMVRDKRIKGITDLRDESDRHGIRIVIEVKRGGRPKSVLNKLFKFTTLQTSYSANMLALVNGVPQTLNLRQIILLFLRHRQIVIRRRTVFDLKSAYLHHHILKGLKIALDNLDAVIKTIRASKTVDSARLNLMSKFNLTDLQANAILEMQLRRLAALERQKIEEEYGQTEKIIEDLTIILTDQKRMIKELKKENKYILEKYSDPRRTKIFVKSLKDFSEEDLVPDVPALVSLTKTGYIKRLAKDTYRTQQRGGVGVLGMSTKQEDEIDCVLSVQTHDDLLFFTNKGRVFKTKVWEIVDSTRQSKGQAVINLINITAEERVQAILPLNKDTISSQKYILLATKNGIVKKTSLKQFQNIRQNGLIAIKLDAKDQLTWAKLTDGSDFVFLVSKKGKCIRFLETDSRPMGRHTRGVRGIHLKEDDFLVSMDVIPPKQNAKDSFEHILVVSEKGVGKRSNAYLYPLQKRGGIGVKVANLSNRTGLVAVAQVVNQNHRQVILTSKHAITIRLPLKNIPQLGRNTRGVILMRFKTIEDKVNAMTVLQRLEANPEDQS